ncbi:MAG: hypothetical protein ACM3X9_11715 [Bacillota bacterium]
MNSLRKNNQYFVTSEFLAYPKLIEPMVVQLLKKYRFGLCLCIREEQLNDELAQLCKIYASAGIPLIFWPLLPLKEGLYLNKYSVTEYHNYLDLLFAWLEKKKLHVFGLLVDVEPDYHKPKPGSSPIIDNIWHSLKELDEEAFKAAISGFQGIIGKIRRHNCLAIGAALPFVCDDRSGSAPVWQDYWGGPVAEVEWDILVFMLFGSWFVEMGMDWPTAHCLVYDYTKEIKKFWQNKAVVSLGVTTPGTGAETAIYKSPAQLGEAVSAVRAAGINNIAIYDLKGILDSAEPELWFQTVVKALPRLPSGRCDSWKLFLYRIVVATLGKTLELFRSLKEVGEKLASFLVRRRSSYSRPQTLFNSRLKSPPGK